MHDVLKLILLACVALTAATLAAVSGFGGAALLLPVVTAIFGIREAVPILTIAQLIGNASRVWFNRREVNGRVVGWFALGAVPFALIGGTLFAIAPARGLKGALGAFLILLVIWRRLRKTPQRGPTLRGFAILGAISSVVSALLGSVGPLMAPFFLAYGLVKGAYIGTEALCTVVMHVTKLLAYGQAKILTQHSIIVGLGLGPLMIAGSFLGHRIVNRLPTAIFVGIVELFMVVAGILFLAGV
jgi:hypothetical protein